MSNYYNSLNSSCHGGGLNADYLDYKCEWDVPKYANLAPV